MKQFFHKILSVLMAVVVLFSTMSFTIGMHYCGDTLIDVAYFKEAKSCGMEIQNDVDSGMCSIMKKNCCSDEQIIIEGQDDLKLSIDQFSTDKQLFVAVFVLSYTKLFESEESQLTQNKAYPPPLIVKDIQKLDEVYII